MPSRSRYTIWDYLWVSQKDVQRERVRSPHPLGRRRSLPQRLVLMWRRSTRNRVILGMGAGSVWAGTVILVLRLQQTKGMAGVSALVLLLLVFASIVLVERMNRPDARCILATRGRTRITKGNSRLEIARAVAERRRWWRIRTREMSIATKSALVNYSSTGRWVSAAFLTTMVFGSLLITLLSQAISRQMAQMHPTAAGALPVRINNGLGFSPAFLWLGVLAGYLVYRHFYLKDARMKLGKSLEGKGCADCGYEVEPGALIETEPGVSIAIGPSRCSECGSPWPLVPSDVVPPPKSEFWQF